MNLQQNHLLEILTELSKAKVKFIVCGGVAVVFHGVERMTVDLDIIIDFSPTNVHNLLIIIKKLKLISRAPISPEILMHKEKRQFLIDEKGALVFTFIDVNNPYRMIDILLTDENLYDKLFPNSDIVKIKNHSFRILSKKQLIAMKKNVKPMRDKDIFDINALKKL